MSSLNWSLFANVGLLNLFTGSYSANAICQGRGSPSEKWIREYLWYTSTLRRIVTNVLLYILYIHSSGCISILSYRQPKKRTIATLSLSLQSLRPILRYIYIYIHSMVLKTTPCLLAWDPPDWKWLSCRNLGSNYCYFSGSQQSWRKSSHDMFHNPEFWLSSQVIHRILSHQQTILALVLQAW